MVNQQLITYLITNIQRGYSKESLIQALRTSGYDEHDIEQAFAIADQQQTNHLPFHPPKPPHISSKVKPRNSNFPRKNLLLVCLGGILLTSVLSGFFIFNKTYNSKKEITKPPIKTDNPVYVESEEPSSPSATTLPKD